MADLRLRACRGLLLLSAMGKSTYTYVYIHINTQVQVTDSVFMVRSSELFKCTHMHMRTCTHTHGVRLPCLSSRLHASMGCSSTRTHIHTNHTCIYTHTVTGCLAYHWYSCSDGLFETNRCSEKVGRRQSGEARVCMHVCICGCQSSEAHTHMHMCTFMCIGVLYVYRYVGTDM